MPEDPQTLFQRKSRSFSLAALLFSAGTREDIARLYQFCRHVDDLADSSHAGEPEKLRRLEGMLDGGSADCDDPVLSHFIRLARQRKLPLGAARELIAASAADCGPRCLQTEAELIRFAYGVAGTVGLLMQPLLGADDPRAAAFAIDLGIALQLTNIARDVAEDVGRDRFYLPAAWVRPGVIQTALCEKNPTATDQVDKAVQQLLKTADRYYESALAGHWFIPPRNRRAIFFALHFYRAIGRKMQRQGSGAWRSRTRIGLFGKLAVGLAAYPRYQIRRKRDWSRKEAPRHDRALHEPLDEGHP